MPRPLRDSLVEFSQDWQSDLPPAWAAMLAGVEPDAASVRDNLLLRDDEVVFPGRKGNTVAGSPANSHVFRALDRIDPSQVRAVIIGQDPYPRPTRATGRAFDQGDLRAWGTATTTSLRKVVQALAHERTGEAEFLAGTGWTRVLSRINEGTLAIPAPSALFDHWEDEGVLLLNAGLTLSRYEQGGAPEQKNGHIPFWRPVIQALLRGIAQRPDGHVAFLAWGGFARDVVLGSGVAALPQWETQAFLVRHAHPAAYSGFLTDPGPFTKANAELTDRGAPPIAW